MNHGILANQLGHREEAIQSWDKAIALDDSQLAAYLYVAGELDREKAEAAIPYYMKFLDKVSQAGANSRPPAHSLIAIILRLAQCQIQAKHLDQAEKAYELAQKLAAQTGERRMENIASASEAELKAGQGKTAQALQLYQHALTLDNNLDARSEAGDLYSYAVFLRDSGFPPRLAYACLLKSEFLMQNFKDTPEFKSAALARKDLERKTGAESALLRRNPDSALHEALALTFP